MALIHISLQVKAVNALATYQFSRNLFFFSIHPSITNKCKQLKQDGKETKIIRIIWSFCKQLSQNKPNYDMIIIISFVVYIVFKNRHALLL